MLALGGTQWPWDLPEIATSRRRGGHATGALVVHLRRVPEPVLPLELFSDRLFVVACTVVVLTFMGMAGSGRLLPTVFFSS